MVNFYQTVLKHKLFINRNNFKNNTMKKLIAILGIAAIFASCNGNSATETKADSGKTDSTTTTMPTIANGTMAMKNGKMQVMNDQQWVPMDSAFTCTDGCKVMTNGQVIMKSGDKMMLKEGEMVETNGMMMDAHGDMMMKDMDMKDSTNK